jgi:glycosyltransferase involved in cell wall biosynthesis
LIGQNRNNLYIIIYKIFLNIIFFFIFHFLLVIKKGIDNDKISFNGKLEKDKIEEFADVQNYLNLVLNGTIIDKEKIYQRSITPKISIIISVYNGEAYIKTAILSIQNQDLKDIEIIIVDDNSKDNSVNLIKEIMKTEPRIFLYQNQENKGPLFTKSKGVLHAKGKYVMILDEDDIYVQREAFSTLYMEAEKSNIDILGFIGIVSGEKIPINRSNFPYVMNKIIYQPNLSNLMYHYDSKGRIRQFGGNLCNLFIKTHLYKNIIKLIDSKNMNTTMKYHDDFIILFLLMRNAYNIKFIDRLFYVWLRTWNSTEPKIKFRTQIKKQDINNKKCFSYLNFLEILFKNTKNTFEDKKIVFSELERWYLNTHCRTNEKNKDKAIKVIKSFLKSEYFSNGDKKQMQDFIANSKE